MKHRTYCSCEEPLEEIRVFEFPRVASNSTKVSCKNCKKLIRWTKGGKP